MTITYIQTSCNVQADYQSRRHANDDIEWSLDQQVFDKLTDMWGVPEVDLFANRLNHKVPKYMAWHRDPGAIAIDALHNTWEVYKYLYVFCPFSLVPRVLNKLHAVKSPVQLLMIIPCWPGQLWWNSVMDLVIEPIQVLPPTSEILRLPHNLAARHPLKTLNLLACKISTCRLLQSHCQHQLKKQYPRLVHRLHNGNIKHTGTDGYYIVSRWGKIPTVRLL